MEEYVHLLQASQITFKRLVMIQSSKKGMVCI